MNINRDYEFVIQVGSDVIKFAPPWRIVFDCTKSIYGGINKANFQLFNIPERYRLRMVKDSEQAIRIPVSLSVGYQDKKQLIFKGTVQVGKNERQGPDIVTTLECLDGGYDYLYSFTSRTVKGGKTAVDAILQDMTNTDVGRINERPTLTRPKVLVGNSSRLLSEAMGLDETWFIDDEQLFIMKDNEVVSRFIPLVNARTGLISTPTREASIVSFSLFINPTVKIGRRAQLESVTAPHLDGIYKITDINYSGDNEGPDWNMTCSGRFSQRSIVI